MLSIKDDRLGALDFREDWGLHIVAAFYVGQDSSGCGTNGSPAVQSFQRSPRHIRHNVPASINQSDICGLHEYVDENNFKNAFPLSASYMLTFLRNDEFGCS